MNIIIAGAGKVGFNLAKTLSISHNVIIIDKNSKALRRIQESLDILTIKGDVENSEIYLNIVDKNIDLFIAVTNIDNVNLISALIAESQLNIQRKFIRLQNHFYDQEMIQNKFNIEKIIFPRKLASETIASLLSYPKANNVKSFKYTNYKLISVRAHKDLQSFILELDDVIVVGIERDKEFFIPKTNIEIQPNDLIYFFGLVNNIAKICSKLEPNNTKNIKNCVVFGGEDLGISISKSLVKIEKNVKLIETDFELCKKADKILQGRVSIINLKYGTTTLFEDEELDKADIFIAATNNDEYNIIKCLEAKDRGIHKVVAINNELEYYNLMHSLGIIVTRGPKISAYNTIMEHISSTGVVIQKSFCGAKAVVFMRKIFNKSTLINKTIKPIKDTKQTLIFYVKDNKLNIFNSKIVLQENDLIIVFCRSIDSAKMQKWIYEL